MLTIMSSFRQSSASDILYFYFSFCMLTILRIRDHTCLQSCTSDFVCFYFSVCMLTMSSFRQSCASDFVCFYFLICKLTISSSRVCVLLLLNLQAQNFELQKSRAYNLVVNILYAFTSQFVHLILALITYTHHSHVH